MARPGTSWCCDSGRRARLLGAEQGSLILLVLPLQLLLPPLTRLLHRRLMLSSLRLLPTACSTLLLLSSVCLLLAVHQGLDPSERRPEGSIVLRGPPMLRLQCCLRTLRLLLWRRRRHAQLQLRWVVAVLRLQLRWVLDTL